MDRFKALNIFVTIVTTGGFTKAARQLAVSPSVVSKNVQDLETLLGVQLFRRTTRQVSLTETGDRYYRFARRILAEIDEEAASLSSIQQEPSGTLRVATSNSFGIFKLSPIVAEFLISHPRIQMFLEFKNEFRFHPSLFIKSGFDLAICIAPRIDDSSLIAKKVGEAEWTTCASPLYVAAHGSPRTPRDLLKHNCLSLVRDGGGATWEYEGSKGRTSIKVSGSLTSTVVSVREAALHGLGIASLPLYSVDRDLEDGRLVRVLPAYAIATRTIYALYPSKKALSARTRVFMDYLSAQLKGSRSSARRWAE